jgi:hypothetical protein
MTMQAQRIARYASLALAAPGCMAAGALRLRQHRLAPAIALGPALYAVYTYSAVIIGAAGFRLLHPRARRNRHRSAPSQPGSDETSVCARWFWHLSDGAGGGNGRRHLAPPPALRTTLRHPSAGGACMMVVHHTTGASLSDGLTVPHATHMINDTGRNLTAGNHSTAPGRGGVMHEARGRI